KRSIPIKLAFALAWATLICGCAVEQREHAQAALPAVDLPNYMGEWHQIAHIPNWFQASCVSGAKATYRLLRSGEVEVRNECQTKSGLDSVV
ncbi:lipocalin family protein, partial [Pseudoxanthomonas sp. KAs_5_3]